MKRFLSLLVILCLGVSALYAANGGKFADSLLNMGAKAIQAEQQRRAELRAARQMPSAEQAGGQAAEQGEAEGKRTWRDKGKDMLAAFMNRSQEGLGDVSVGTLLGQASKEAMDVLINEYKEQYKQEGREYAREVGDKIVERVREDPKISSSITSLKILCWVAIAYLTLVTLIMLFSLLRLKRANKHIEEKLESLLRRLPRE